MNTPAFLQHYFANWLRKRIPGAREHQLNMNNVFILPSKFGWAFLLTLLALFLLGTNYQNNLMLLLCYFLLAIMLLNLFVSYLNFARLNFKLGKVNPTYVGEQAQLPLWLNTTRKKADGLIQLHFYQHSEQQQIDLNKLQNPVYMPWQCQQRGRINLPRLTISSYYPFGLYRCWTHLDFDVQLLVYPKPLPCSPNLIADAGQDEQQHCALHCKEIKGQDDFFALKSYRTGEPLNHVAWKQVAKGRGMLSKEFSSQTQQKYWLVLNNASGETLETELSQLCYAVNQLSQNDNAFGLRLQQQQINPANGSEHQQACLTALALYGLDSAE